MALKATIITQGYNSKGELFESQVCHDPAEPENRKFLHDLLDEWLNSLANCPANKISVDDWNSCNHSSPQFTAVICTAHGDGASKPEPK